MNLKTYLSNSERGRAKELAKELEVSKSYLSQLVSGKCPISPARAMAIETLTGGQVSRKDLRPDDWHLIWTDLK